MKLSLQRTLELYRRLWTLARQFGLRRLLNSLALSISQGVFQVVGITSVLPFLLLASDPDRFRNSSMVKTVLSLLPPMDTRELLLFSGSVALVSLVVANVVNFTAEYIRMRYVHEFGHWLRMRLLRSMVNQPYAYFLQRNSAELLKKLMNDTLNTVTGVMLPSMDSIVRIVTVALLLGLLLLLNPLVTIILGAIFGSFYAVVFRLMTKKRRKATEGYKASFSGTFHSAQQLLTGIKPIKVHGAEPGFIERFETHSRMAAESSAKGPIFGNAPRYIVETLAFGSVVLFAMFASLGMGGGGHAGFLAQLAFFAAAGYRLLPALQLLYGNVTNISLFRHCVDDVWKELTENEQPGSRVLDQNGPASPAGHFTWDRELALTDISYAYAGAARPVLDGVDLRIEKNASVGIIGSTGSGKSTLIDILIGLHRPTGGGIILDGRPLESASIRSWQAAIGYVPQDIFLMDATIAENIALGVPAEAIDRGRLREVAATAQILGFIEKEAPDGFQSKVGERGVRLSGGQRQRIGIARALYHRPELLVFDEATSALDGETEAALIETIEGLHGSLTMVIVSHRPAAVAGCDRVFALRAGRLEDARTAL